jgi:crotonobetainyl-CoA:carnitine CoA-transferase CaiB-like acyl-CoA transferase
MEPSKPLRGMRILSIEQFGSAPYGSMFLADMGAEVIKIENAGIGGDPSRRTGPHLLGDSDSLYFQTWNQNKRSVVLDLKSAEGWRDFEQLVLSADAVMNNLRGDLPGKMGLDYQSLSLLNRKIVCLHISAYGRDNDRAAWPGYDFLMQAEAGLMSITGDPGGTPARFGPSIIDYMTGVTGVVGLLACLMRARETGAGCDVDTCLFDVALHQLGYAAMWYLNAGTLTGRVERSAHFSVTPVQTFTTADGWIFVMCMTEKFWQVLTQALGREDLNDDPRFRRIGERTAHRAELTAVLDAEFRKKSTAQWLAALGSILPVAPVLDVKQALDNPFVDRTEMIRSVPHPLNDQLRVLANPLKIDGRRLEQATPSALGQDNDALLASRRNPPS